MHELTGAGGLLRLALRRDRVMVPAWVLAIAATVLATVSSYRDLYPDPADLEVVARTVDANPALVALSGPAVGLDSIGGLTAWKVGGFVAVLAAALSILLVVRHTRAEEETGRLELLRAGVAGRQSALAAGLVVALAADLALVVLVALACVAYGLPAAGGLALGLLTGLTGAVFAGAAAVAAQVTRASRTANAASFGVLAAAFLLRAVGDSTGPGWLSWLSPVGWGQAGRPFAGERWWAFLLPVAATGVLVGTAAALSRRRDLGEALLTERPGPARGVLAGPLGLAWRLQRVTTVIWVVGFVATGTLLGTITPGIGAMVAGNDQIIDVLSKLGGAQGVTDAFTAAMIRIGGLVAAVFAVTAVVRIRTEETSGTAEQVLATAVGRGRWAGAQLGLALAATVVLLAGFGLGAGLGAVLADPGGATSSTLLDPLAGALLQLPAVWVVAGVGVALFGLLPRFTALAWVVLAAVLFLNWLGPVLQLDRAVLNASPFTHVPSIPGGSMDWVPELWLATAALALVAAGLAGWRRRDSC